MDYAFWICKRSCSHRAIFLNRNHIPGTRKLRFIEVKGRISGAKTVTVSRNEILTALNKPDDYARPLDNSEIPYRLLDGKAVLSNIRKKIADQFNVSFSDREVLTEYETVEIPKDLQEVLNVILEMFEKN